MWTSVAVLCVMCVVYVCMLCVCLWVCVCVCVGGVGVGVGVMVLTECGRHKHRCMLCLEEGLLEFQHFKTHPTPNSNLMLYYAQ